MRRSGGRPRKAILLAFVAVLALCVAVEGVEFARGTGEPNDPYQIATAAQLLGIGTASGLRG
jgi:hypothetical protein